jgi:hypothetical protein
MNRRELLYSTGMGLVGGTMAQAAGVRPSEGSTNSQPPALNLAEYEPKSMLQVKETHIDRARFPVIDIHTHISVSANSKNGVDITPERQYLSSPEELLDVMDRNNIRSMVNLTGGFDSGLTETVRRYDRAHPDRFYTFAEPSYPLILRPDYPKLQAEAIEKAHGNGARDSRSSRRWGSTCVQTSRLEHWCGLTIRVLIRCGINAAN